MELDKVCSADFAAHQGSTFRLSHDAEFLFDVELIEVTETRGGHLGRRLPFSLIFRGPSTPFVAQMIYRLEHERMGAMELFLVPIGPDELGMRYQAILA